MRGVNDDEAVPLLRFALDHGYELRFIEQMPLDAGHTWRRDEMVTAEEILARLQRGVRPDARPGRSAAPRRPRPGWSREPAAAPAKVGVIASVSPAVLRRLRPHPAHRRRRRCAPACSARTETDLRSCCCEPAADDERPRRRVARGDVGQAAGPRHRRPVVPAAGPTDVGDRRLTAMLILVRYFAGARAAAGVGRGEGRRGDARPRCSTLLAEPPRPDARPRCCPVLVPGRRPGLPRPRRAARRRRATVDVLPPFAGG